MRSLIVLGALLAVPFVIGTAAGPGAPDADEQLAFRDPAILESSGLVVDGDIFVTTNDSGDRGRIFAVDRDGETVGVTSWSGAPEDVEALAPAGPGEVWVGDIGDNPSERSSISVSRVPVGRVDQTVDPASYELVYPDGAHDAEALLAHPGTGQFFVVTKAVFGGQVFAAPERLATDRPNRLREVGQVAGLVSDGAFLPDGRHVVLRTYTKALVYTFPDLEVVGDVDLPRQQQGEGIAVAPDGSLYLSSEGLHAPLLLLTLPDRVQDAIAEPTAAEPTATEPTATGPTATGPTTATDSASASSSGSPATAEPREEAPRQEAGPDVTSWLIGLGVMALIVITLLRALRPR